MRFISIIFWFFTLCTYSQHIITLDGINDNFYAEPGAGNGVRTIELWFKPAQVYDPSLSEYVSLVCQEGNPGPNYEEYYIAFEPLHMTHPGHIRFAYFKTPTEYYDVFSNGNFWEAGIWYHVAGVFHPDSGMMLFVDGIRQNGTAAFYNETPATYFNLAVGAWGYPPNGGYDRYFNGSVDDIRISDIARYSKDFTPPCLYHRTDIYTIALWNLEEGSGVIINDSSGNGFHATYLGGTPEWESEHPCLGMPVGDFNDELNFNINIYPIPAKDLLCIDLNSFEECKVCLYNTAGLKVLERVIRRKDHKRIQLDVAKLLQGMYYLRILTDNINETRKVLVAR
ncbi:MAG: LamG-like jellyroll fold domain-containing protein [Bacteroidota bacterium]